MSGLTQGRMDKVFAALERAACEGKRCPVLHEVVKCPESSFRLRSDEIPALAKAGRVRVEISGRNWRTVHILTGRHAGKSTKPNPDGGAPYLVIDKNGTRRNGKPIEQRPSQFRVPPASPNIGA